MDLVVKSPDELIAVIPHVLGFQPEESIVLMPISTGLPFARIDLPRNQQDRNEVLLVLQAAYSRHVQPGDKIALVCVTADRPGAELASQHLAGGLEVAGIETTLRLWANGQRWVELNTGATGDQIQQVADRLAATTVLAGVAQPAPSRGSLAASLIGDRTPIAAVLPAAREAAQGRTPTVERDWVVHRLEQFHSDGNRLSDPDVARLLVAIETVGTRDALWTDMTRDNTASHIALWSDLTRRAPDDARAAPASLLGFSSWLRGDGARAWCALDQVPADKPYPLAEIVASALQHGLNPRDWEKATAHLREGASELDESFVPTPRSQSTDRDMPRPNQGQNPAAPGR